MKWISILKKSGTKSSISGKQIAVKNIYSVGSLKEFAEKHNITWEELLNFNKKLLKKYSRITNDEDKERFKRNLQGEALVVGYKTVESVTSTLDSVIQKEGILTFEKDIISKIDKLGSEINDIRDENKTLVEIVKSFIAKEKLTTELNEIKSKLKEEESRRQDIENQLHLFKEKVIIADFLVQYAEVVNEFFILIRSGHNKALELYRKLQTTDEKSHIVLGQLLMKYNINLPQNTGVWEGIVTEITKNQVTSNPDLIKKFKQYSTTKEIDEKFKSMLLKDILQRYASCILILTEELSNLSKFTNNFQDIIREFENYFLSFEKQLHNKIINLGLDLKYVPLFKDSNDFKGFTHRINQICSLPYKNVNGLEENAILEIVSYGFDDTEKTKVILA
jgi:hypothetical protein